MKYEDVIVLENLTKRALELLGGELDASMPSPERVSALSKLLEVLAMIDINKDEDDDDWKK